MINIQSEYEKLKNDNLNIFIQIVEQSPNSVIITNTDGNIEYINQMFTKITGYSREEVINQNPRILNAGTQTKEYYTEMWKTITNGKTWHGEFHNKKKNSELYWEKVKISPIKNESGKITHYLGIKEDITKLKESEERLKSFLNVVPDIICYKDGQGRWLLANDADLELFSLTEVDYFGKTDAELANFTHEIYKASFLTCMITDEIAWKNKTISHVVEIIPTIDGNERFYDVFKIPSFYPNGKRKGLAVIGRDITEIKRKEDSLIKLKEKAEESNRLKTEFLNNMSHEIRTPMNAILGFSNILGKPNLTREEQKQYIDIIQTSGKQLLKIINDILEISKLGTKQVKITEKAICLNSLLSEHFSIFRLKAGEKKIPLYLKTGLSDNESTIISDDTKLNKILSNLLENAIKFTNEGFIEFGYQLKNRKIEIYVKDTGIGIISESQKNIFERFSQEEKGLSRKVGGLGLGLSISKENAELLGGKITLHSEKGKGSTFFVTIPYKPVNKKILIHNSEKDKEIITVNQDQFTILIVEDEEVNYLYIEILLRNLKLNFITLHAKNGKEAVEMCKENSEVDLVLMDMKMPIMTGFEATKLIKQFRPNLPIVAQTAYSTNDEKEHAFSVGCDDFISKPISEKTINGIINKYLIM
jgi:PAS domain S-box-containing protein